jgi:hypothetical protein
MEMLRFDVFNQSAVLTLPFSHVELDFADKAVISSPLRVSAGAV